jgi:DASS family divalent anion:Na+ symporter
MIKVYKTLFPIVFISAIAWMMIPPEQLSIAGWNLLILFAATMAAIIIVPLPLGVIAIFTITVATTTGILDVNQILSGFSSKISFLILLALFISDSIVRSGLGNRLAYFLISKSSNSLLGLSYVLILCDLIISPAIPSVTARGGGIIYPIVQSLVDVINKEEKRESVKLYLIQICFQSTVITSTISLTAMAANPLIVSIASALGIVISWNTWFVAASIPGVVNLLLLPFMLCYILKPHNIDIGKIKGIAKANLSSYGRISKNQIIISATLLLLFLLWSFGDWIGIDATVAALIGFSILLLTKAVEWEHVIGNYKAWGIFVWYSVLITLSGFLVKFQVIDWVSKLLFQFFNYEQKSIIAVGLILLLFFFLHYFFVSTTAYISTLFAPFLILLLAFDVPGKVAVMILAIFAILSGGLTHYTLGVGPIYFAASNVSAKQWAKIGFFISVLNVTIWSIVCVFWWKIIGWY